MPSYRKPRVPGIIRPCGLIRVSSDEQVEQFSLPMQVHKIQTQSQERLGVALPEEDIFREEGISGRPSSLKKRPGLDAALKACIAGKYTHLIVHKLDRLGRNVGLVSSVLETLEEHDIVFISVHEQVDASTAAGRLYISMQSTISQWYSDNLSEETRKGKEGRKRAGLYNGALPFGIVKGEGRHALPIPDTRLVSLEGADGITRQSSHYTGLCEIFERYGQGESARDIARWLNEQGYRTTGTHGRNHFTKDTVNIILKNRFYIGDLPDGQGGWVPGQQGLLIDQGLWDAAQQVRQRYQANPQTIPGNARVHILGGGLLRCGHCWHAGRSMALHVSRSLKVSDTARYACRGRIQGFSCEQASVAESLLEAQVSAILDHFTLPDDYQDQLLAMFARDRQSDEDQPETDPEVQRGKLEARLARQRDLYELGDWTKGQYLEARQQVLLDLQSIEMEQAPLPDRDFLTNLGSYVHQVKEAWEDADKAHRRMLIRTLFKVLWVQGERIVAVTPVEQFEPFLQLAWHAQERGSDPQNSSVTVMLNNKKLAATWDGDKRVRTSGPDRTPLTSKQRWQVCYTA